MNTTDTTKTDARVAAEDILYEVDIMDVDGEDDALTVVAFNTFAGDFTVSPDGSILDSDGTCVVNSDDLDDADEAEEAVKDRALQKLLRLAEGEGPDTPNEQSGIFASDDRTAVAVITWAAPLRSDCSDYSSGFFDCDLYVDWSGDEVTAVRAELDDDQLSFLVPADGGVGYVEPVRRVDYCETAWLDIVEKNDTPGCSYAVVTVFTVDDLLDRVNALLPDDVDTDDLDLSVTAISNCATGDDDLDHIEWDWTIGDAAGSGCARNLADAIIEALDEGYTDEDDDE